MGVVYRSKPNPDVGNGRTLGSQVRSGLGNGGMSAFLGCPVWLQDLRYADHVPREEIPNVQQTKWNRRLNETGDSTHFTKMTEGIGYEIKLFTYIKSIQMPSSLSLCINNARKCVPFDVIHSDAAELIIPPVQQTIMAREGWRSLYLSRNGPALWNIGMLETRSALEYDSLTYCNFVGFEVLTAVSTKMTVF
jgi:hypothetical protein